MGGWGGSNPFNTITFYALVIVTTLIRSKSTLEQFIIEFEVPRTHLFGSNGKILQSDHCELIWDYQKCQNAWFFSIGGHKNDPRTRTEPSKPKWQTFGEPGLRKTR